MKKLFWTVVVLAGIVGAAVGWFYVEFGGDFDLFRDEMKAKLQEWQGYTASTEISEMAEDLQLTRKGTAIFFAAKPELMAEEAFSAACENGIDGVFVAGCYSGGPYTDEKIAIYNAGGDAQGTTGTEFNFQSYRKIVGLHEMLHAVWTRFPDEEQTKNCANLKILAGEIKELQTETELYAAEEICAELFTRVGSEYIAAIELKTGNVTGLDAAGMTAADDLAKVYNDYFTVENMELVTAYWENEGKLVELKTKIENYQNEMKAERAETEKKIEEYYAEPTEGNYWIANLAVGEYNTMIDTYNQLVEKYQMIYGELDSSISEKLGI